AKIRSEILRACSRRIMRVAGRITPWSETISAQSRTDHGNLASASGTLPLLIGRFTRLTNGVSSCRGKFFAALLSLRLQITPPEKTSDETQPRNAPGSNQKTKSGEEHVLAVSAGYSFHCIFFFVERRCHGRAGGASSRIDEERRKIDIDKIDIVCCLPLEFCRSEYSGGDGEGRRSTVIPNRGERGFQRRRNSGFGRRGFVVLERLGQRDRRIVGKRRRHVSIADRRSGWRLREQRDRGAITRGKCTGRSRLGRSQ